MDRSDGRPSAETSDAVAQAEYLNSLSQEEMESLNLQVLAEAERAKQALDKLFAQAEKGQALKLNVLETRSFAGWVWQLTMQNTELANLADHAADALEAKEKKKRIWRPKK